MAPNNIFWNLVFMNFSGMDDVGRYSCSDSGEMLTLNIGTGKLKGPEGNLPFLLEAM